MDDLYSVLGLTPSCTADEIKKQYKKLALQYHPDRHNTESDHQRAACEKKFKDIAAAYEVLSDATRRRAYDQLRREQQQQAQSYDSFSSSSSGRAGGSAGGYSSSFHNNRPRPSQQQQFFNNSGFERMEDPFMGNFGFGMFGPTPSPSRPSPHHPRGMHSSPFASFFNDFAFRDPFALFDEIFQQRQNMFAPTHQPKRSMPHGHEQQQQPRPQRQAMMPMRMMGGSLFGGEDPYRQGSLFGRGADPFDEEFGLMAAMMGDLGLGSGLHNFSSMGSMSRGGSKGASMQSMMTSVTTVVHPNGQRVTKTVRTVQRPDGIVTEDVDEQVEEGCYYGAGHHQGMSSPSSRQQALPSFGRRSVTSRADVAPTVSPHVRSAALRY